MHSQSVNFEKFELISRNLAGVIFQDSVCAVFISVFPLLYLKLIPKATMECDLWVQRPGNLGGDDVLPQDPRDDGLHLYQAKLVYGAKGLTCKSGKLMPLLEELRTMTQGSQSTQRIGNRILLHSSFSVLASYHSGPPCTTEELDRLRRTKQENTDCVGDSPLVLSSNCVGNKLNRKILTGFARLFQVPPAAHNYRHAGKGEG